MIGVICSQTTFLRRSSPALAAFYHLSVVRVRINIASQRNCYSEL